MNWCSELNYFDSFLCSFPDCQEPNPNENTLLNCFHTVCNGHIQQGQVPHCSNESCLLLLEKDSSLISIPRPQDRCKNPVSCHLARELSGLKFTRQNGNKCKMCEYIGRDLEFCIQCSSVWCENHKENCHKKFGRLHDFVQFGPNNEEIVNDIFRVLRNVPKTGPGRELNALVDLLTSRRESMANNLENIEKRMVDFEAKTKQVINETEKQFEKIRRHLEIMREENMKSLREKSDQLLTELAKKREIIQFKANATDRALNIAFCVQNVGLKTDTNFTKLLTDSNSFTLSDHLTEIPNAPIEHINVPKGLKMIENELNRLLRFEEAVSCHEWDVEEICIDTTNSPVICFYFKLPLTNSNYKSSNIRIFYGEQCCSLFPGCSPGPDHTYVKFPLVHCPGKRITSIRIQILTDGSGNGLERTIQINPHPGTLGYVQENHGDHQPLSTLRVEPGLLTCLTKSRTKIFAVCKDANEIRRYDTLPQVSQTNGESIWNPEFTFGVGHLIDPRGICVFDSVVFVSDCFHHAVFCFTVDGSFISRFGCEGNEMGQFRSPMGLSVNVDNGKLIVADNGNNRIQILLLNTQCWESFKANDGIELEGMPVDVKLNTLGSFFILTHAGEIFKYDKFYVFYGSILLAISICPIVPFFEIDNNDVIYVCSLSDGEKDKGSVYLITDNGDGGYNFRRHPTLPRGLCPGGLTVDEDFRLFIAHNEPCVPATPTRSLVYVVENDFDSQCISN